MKVKVIAIERISSQAQSGRELVVSKKLADALVKLGKARYADESQAPEAAPPTVEKPKPRGRPRRAPTGAPVGAVTRADAVGTVPPAIDGAAPAEGTTEQQSTETPE